MSKPGAQTSAFLQLHGPYVHLISLINTIAAAVSNTGPSIAATATAGYITKVRALKVSIHCNLHSEQNSSSL
jgi:hypothetical protein